MPAKSTLDDVVQNLETNDQVLRIKKILICAAHGKWENDSATIQNTSMRDLVQSLYWNTQGLDRLNQILTRILSKINKKAEYTVIVNTVLSQVGRLYIEGETDAATEAVLTAYQPSDRPQSQLQDSPIWGGKNQLNVANKKIENLFDVRFKIMQHANPLRVKILIYSALENEFTFSDRDWLHLKSIELDDLIEQLFQMFPTFEALKAYLKKMVEYLEDSHEDAQVATVLIEAMRLCYDRQHLSPNYLQGFPSPDEGDRLGNRQSAGSSPGTQFGNPPPAGVDINESQTVRLLISQEIEPQSGTVVTETSDELSSLQTIQMGNPEGGGDSSITPENRPNSGPTSIRDRLGFADEIQKRVSQGVTEAMTSITNTLESLENDLATGTGDPEPRRQLDMKYAILKDFMGQVREQVKRLEDIIHESEAAERQQTEPTTSVSAATAPEIPPQTEEKDGGIHQIVELARQGNPKAIASLLNHLLKSKGIHTLAQSKNGCLHLILESEHNLAPESILHFFQKKLHSLQLQSIRTVKIYCRKPGQKTFTWTQEFGLN
ncbi:MAG: hypothetical protein ACP5D7_14995 [Limnospira sp.]